ncbi:MAG: UDP-N-acetylmuramoyl-L-alanyl-D-glutamate--2,6-diaminopimelate ligase [Ruminococcus sp.]|jgi:UDP-N-acetylmuramyl-tripeptide synthetase/UDP-N-acetylmuramoyl-tripeptide--D-alanyl-D-alanine ligase|nr:UDP-N-acetylmuramoyl-L-alanyl-D-glutamate--2,6-diaminopimelate ligase [Ruminococcus sp.]
MKFSELVTLLKKKYTDVDFSAVPANSTVAGVTDNSERCAKDFIFVCIKGGRFDGHNFADQAMTDAEALCVVTERDLGLPCQIIVRNTRDFYGDLCAAWFGNPELRMRFAGITGTNGKTTVASLVSQILIRNQFKVGIIGTTGIFIDDKLIEETKFTTLPVYDFYETLARFATEMVDVVVMEVSSFALAQNRLGPIIFDVSVFTNLTQDHLDIHGTMEHYFESKKLLFTKYSRVAIINTDDTYGDKLYASLSCEKFAYGSGKHASVVISSMQLLPDSSKFRFEAGKDTITVTTSLIGEFNIYNAVAAIGVCTVLGLSISSIIRALSKCTGPKGRCEVIPSARGFTVICDYAHTPDALENILKSIKKTVNKNGRLFCLFGCGGNRDAGKRPIMGKIAEKYADILVVTSDNPRNENPDLIIDEICAEMGYEKTVFRITDRKTAIRFALTEARPDDVVILAGKGHETYQELANGIRIPFDERKVVGDVLSEFTAPPFDPNKKEKMKLGDLIAVTDGNPKNFRTHAFTFSPDEIYTDTRSAQKGGVYLAIRGENFDGNEFVDKAYEDGAAFVIAERSSPSVPAVIVKNSRRALMDIASENRSKFSPIVIGITGSVGKTTTKDMTALALMSKHAVFKTEGNHNNEIGVPLSLLKLNSSATAAVIEMGMSHKGEISRISRAVKPDICVITNIGYAHIENFDSIEDILEAKLEILDGAQRKSPLVINADDKLLMTLVERFGAKRKIVTFGIENEEADYRAVNISSYPDRTQFQIMKNDEFISDAVIYIKGDHNVTDAVCAVAVADLCGVSPAVAGEFLSAYQPIGLRQHITKRGGHTIIEDCYNASPASMESALSMLASMEVAPGGRRVAVLGDMLELGEFSEQLHKEVGESVVKHGIDLLVCYGENAKFIAKRADELGMHSGYSKEKKVIKNFLKYKLKPGDVVLFKASRGMQMEQIIEEFYADN